MNGTTRQYWRRIAASFAVYAAAGWASVEALSTVIERFGLPPLLQPLVVALYVAGLPVTIYLVWRTAGVERRLTGSAFAGAMTFLVLATAALFLATRPEPAAGPTTVAVLPCKVAAAGVNANRAEGFAEDVHARLSRVESVRVISWNSSIFVRERGFDVPQIAEVLHADRLVQCRVGGDSQRLEIFAELIDPGENRVLWNRDYEFAISDIGTVVTEVVRTLLDVLTSPAQAAELKRIDDIGTFSPEAYDLYLQARGSKDRQEQRGLLDKALEIDPNYANALMMRADIEAGELIWEDRDYIENVRKALEILQAQVERVLAIDPGMPEARSLLAGLCGDRREYLGDDCSPEEQRRLEREACELLGDTADGWACRHRLFAADEEASHEVLMRWLELEPTSPDANMQYLAELYILRQPDELLRVFDTLRMLYPDDRRPFGLVSNLLRSDGRLDEVVAWRIGWYDDRMPSPDQAFAHVRFATDLMDLGLYDLAEQHAMLVHDARRIYMPYWVGVLWRLRGAEQEAAELNEWAVNEARKGGITPALLDLTGRYFDLVGAVDKTRDMYHEILAERDLETLCEGGGEAGCVFAHALRLRYLAAAEGNGAEAAGWLAAAESAWERMLPYVHGIQNADRTRDLEGLLRLAQGRMDEALLVLREAVFLFETPNNNGQDLVLPLYMLETNPLFDPLRGRPEFQALLSDYDDYLAPMRARVLQASETGDWASLRQNTLTWLRAEAE